VWIKETVSQIKKRTQIEGVWEQGSGVNIWIYEGMLRIMTVKGDAMGDTCSMHGKGEKCVRKFAPKA